MVVELTYMVDPQTCFYIDARFFGIIESYHMNYGGWTTTGNQNGFFDFIEGEYLW